MNAIQKVRFLTVLWPRGFGYWAYDSFGRCNADTLGTTEARGPSGNARRRFTWTTIGGDFDINTNAVVAGDAQANKVLNPGFETGGMGGDFNGGAEVDDGTSDDFASWSEQSVNDPAGDKAEATATKHGGNYAIKLTQTVGSVHVRQTMVVTSGRLYRYSFWTRGDGAVAGQYRCYDETNWAEIIPATSTGIAGIIYTLLSFVVAAPTDCVAARLFCYSSIGGTAYFDDISLLECHAEYIDPGAADVVFSANVTMPASGTDPGGLILRRSGATQFLIQMTPGTTGTDFQLIELDDGVPTARATADVDFSTSTAYRITAALTGQSITVYVDGTSKLTYASASVGETNTQVGIWDSADSNFSFDNVGLWRYADYPHAGGY